MKVTFFGTTTLLFDDGKDQVLFDAHLTRPSLLTWLCGRLRTDRGMADKMIGLYGISRLRAIFISHSHFDHVMDAPYVANRTGAVIYGSSSTLNVGRGGDVPEERLVLFEKGKTYGVGDFRITVIASLHSKPVIFQSDLGQEITKPLAQPCRGADYKEGGSYDFLVENGGKKYLIRPSFNYLEGQLDGIHADVLFLASAGFGRADAVMKERFFAETVGKVRPGLVIPIHWDCFFRPLDRPVKGMPFIWENTDKVMFEIAEYLESKGIGFLIQLPRTSIEI